MEGSLQSFTWVAPAGQYGDAGHRSAKWT